MTSGNSETKPTAPSLLQNWISVAGSILTACVLFGMAYLLGADFLRGFSSPYLGILTYMIAPGFLLLGVALLAGGAGLERRRRRRAKPGEIPPFPRIDFNIPRHRSTFVAVLTATFLLLMLSAVGSYRAYEFTESVMFCGKTCHTVMQPEETAYRESPHARVVCVQCHIGPGAKWFVKSKVSGLYQVYAVLTNKYSRPIPVPVESLRPAQETCEQCHWPRKFFGAVVRENHHYLADETNSPWAVSLLLKVGGGDPSFGPAGGIHWHMNIANKIEYIAKDPQRQVIPWVRVTDPSGKVTVYQSKSEPLTAAEISAAEPRRMDCIDCHNRPAHRYNPPVDSLDTALFTKRIDPSIPFIKQQAISVLTKEYPDVAAARTGIDQALRGYYRSSQAEFTAGHAAAIDQAVAAVQAIYEQNFFPAMKVSWKAYPDNIGHMNFPGCFRCHDDDHVADDGRTVTRECKTCHLISAQGTQVASGVGNPEGLDFEHPVDIGDIWQSQPCNSCHDGSLGGA